MDELIPWLAMGLPAVLVIGVLGWFYIAIWSKPDRDMKRLEERAAAGDPSAQAAVERARAMKEVMTRAAGGGDDAERRHLLAHGTPARAVIVDVRPTGIEVSAGPVPARLVEVVLSIGEGAGATTVTVRDAVSQLHQGRLVKGATVPVRTDPRNPQRVVVLWDAQ